ncbi:hypothetical protein SAMN05421750_10850 [Agrobacterium pusense]|nr:hypothetical protein SAMN05421750_10850 [Agrobacterium pusense]
MTKSAIEREARILQTLVGSVFTIAMVAGMLAGVI